MTTQRMNYDNEIYETLRTFIYYPKRRELVVQIVAGRSRSYLAQNSSNRFVISHTRGNYEYISVGNYTKDIVTRIYGHASICLSMLLPNVDRTRDGNEDSEA